MVQLGIGRCKSVSGHVGMQDDVGRLLRKLETIEKELQAADAAARAAGLGDSSLVALQVDAAVNLARSLAQHTAVTWMQHAGCAAVSVVSLAQAANSLRVRAVFCITCTASIQRWHTFEFSRANSDYGAILVLTLAFDTSCARCRRRRPRG